MPTLFTISNTMLSESCYHTTQCWLHISLCTETVRFAHGIKKTRHIKLNNLIVIFILQLLFLIDCYPKTIIISHMLYQNYHTVCSKMNVKLDGISPDALQNNLQG